VLFAMTTTPAGGPVKTTAIVAIPWSDHNRCGRGESRIREESVVTGPDEGQPHMMIRTR